VTSSPRVLALVGREDGSALWREFQPMAELTRQGHVAEWCRLDDVPLVFEQVALGVYDAIILPRLSWRGDERWIGRAWVDKLHQAGCTVIYELDDDTLTPQIVWRQQLTIERDKSLEDLEHMRRERIAAIRMCDGVTVSNHTLAKVVRQYVETPVRVVPNLVDIRWYRYTLRGVKRVVPPLTIGWAGGARYPEDLEPIAAAWHTIARRYPDVHFVALGYVAPALHAAVPADRLHQFEWRSVDAYLLDLKNIDIGCANVAQNHFNTCKTPIKAWEYTMAGAAVVTSPTLYESVVTDGQDGLVAETAREWVQALSRLIEDPRLRRRLWRNQRRRVAEQHALEKYAAMWLDAWSDIIAAHRTKRWWSSVFEVAV